MNHLVPISEATKSCPRCAEEIKLRATGCRFCGADFTLVTSGYCTHCHHVVTVDGAAATCPKCGSELIDLTIDTELVGHVPPPPRPLAPPPAPRPVASPGGPPGVWVAVPVVGTPSIAAAGTTAPGRAPVGRVRQAVATSARQQFGFQIATTAAVVLALLPLLGVAVESMRIWQRDVGYAREFRTLGPLFVVLGIALAAAAPRQVIPRTIGGSRTRARFGGRRAWARRLKEQTGTRLLLKRAGLIVRIALSCVLWVASALLFQAAFGGEFDEPGVERLPGATVTVVVMLVGLVGSLLMIPGSNARILEVDDEGEVVDRSPSPPTGTVPPPSTPAAPITPPLPFGPGLNGTTVVPPRSSRRVSALPFLVAGIAAVGLAAATFVVIGRGGDDERQPSTVSTPPAAADDEQPIGLPGDEPAATAVETVDGAGATTAPAAPSAATGGTDDINLVSSNAISEESTFTIDGESRYLYLFAELRNDGPDRARIGEATITVRDADGGVIGTRLAYPVDQVLEPGEVTFVEESMPSLTYWEGETNTFPEGWATWDLSFDVERAYEPSAWDEVHLLAGDLVVAPEGSGIRATGTVTNATAAPVHGNVDVYVAVMGPDDRLLVVGWTLATTTDGGDLEVGESIAFEIDMYHDVSLDGASYVVGALATPAT